MQSDKPRRALRAEMSAVLTHPEITPQRPHCLAGVRGLEPPDVISTIFVVAARGRNVSSPTISANQREFPQLFQPFRENDICEFESSQPSHADPLHSSTRPGPSSSRMAILVDGMPCAMHATARYRRKFDACSCPWHTSANSRAGASRWCCGHTVSGSNAWDWARMTMTANRVWSSAFLPANGNNFGAPVQVQVL
jgi:hypothetical protein